MPMFRKKPLLVEAMQFTQETKDQVFHFVCCNKYADFDELGNPTLVVQTLAGVMTVKLGDWMIKTHKNEFYPCTEELPRSFSLFLTSTRSSKVLRSIP